MNETYLILEDIIIQMLFLLNICKNIEKISVPIMVMPVMWTERFNVVCIHTRGDEEDGGVLFFVILIVHN